MEMLSPIAALRRAMRLTQSEFAAKVGLKNGSSVSIFESGARGVPLEIAIRLEELGRIHGVAIDAAALNEGVALARAACLGGCESISALHDADIARDAPPSSTGNTAPASPAAVERAA